MFFSVRVSTTCWLPGASQIATTIVICTRPARCHGGYLETLPFRVSYRTERPCQFPPWRVGLWKRREMNGHCCLVALPSGVSPALPWVFAASGSGRVSHSVPGARGCLRVVLRTSVFRIRLDAQDGMQFLRSETQQVLQVAHETVHVALARCLVNDVFVVVVA